MRLYYVLVCPTGRFSTWIDLFKRSSGPGALTAIVIWIILFGGETGSKKDRSLLTWSLVSWAIRTLQRRPVRSHIKSCVCKFKKLHTSLSWTFKGRFCPKLIFFHQIHNFYFILISFKTQTSSYPLKLTFLKQVNESQTVQISQVKCVSPGVKQ